MKPGLDTALVTGARGVFGRMPGAGPRGAVTIGVTRAGEDATHCPTTGPADAEGLAAAFDALPPRRIPQHAAASPVAPPEVQHAVTIAATQALIEALARSGQAPRQDGARGDEPCRVIGDPGRLRGHDLAAEAFPLNQRARKISAPWRG